MSSPKRILLLHLYSNGDCLYATAIARQIKQDYPGCHLTWVIASFCAKIIDNNPYVDDVWVVQMPTKPANVQPIRQIKKEINDKIARGEYDLCLFTQLADENVANYDGAIRSGIFRCYGRPITVPVTPVLCLRDEELAKTAAFAVQHQLSGYKNVVLFEFAPQSGQIAITPAVALRIANEAVAVPDTAIILSSGIKVVSDNPAIIDGSILTLRETAALSHYCTLMLGCSSGITWVTTSSAGKLLPMIQMLDPHAFWINPVSRDFERFGLPLENLVELYDADLEKAIDCVKTDLTEGFTAARTKYYTPLPVQFISTRRTIYNMLVLLQFRDIYKHIRVNLDAFGPQPGLLKEIALGFLTMPFKLVGNVVRKHILRKGTTGK